MDGHDALEESLPFGPVPFGQVGQPVDFLDPQRGERARETGGRAGREDEFERVGEIGSAGKRRARAKCDRHAVFGILYHRRAVEPQQFLVPVEIGCGDIQVERMARRQQRVGARALGPGRKRAFAQARETEAGKGWFEPAPPDEVRYLALHLGPGFGRDCIGDVAARTAQQPVGEGLRPHLRKAPFQARGGIDQFVDIGDLEPQVGQRFERLARMDRLREEPRVDPARAGPAHDIGQDAQPQAVFVLDPFDQLAVDRLHPLQRTACGVERATGAGQLPQLARDPMHVDRQADAAIADQRYPQFLLPHRPVMAG